VGSTPLPNGVPAVGTDYRVGIQASYELDLWGKYRTATAAARKDLLASEYARETVRSAVAANTAQAYFTLVAADAQLALLEDTLKSREDALALQRDLLQAGMIGEYEFHAAEAERAAVVSDIAVAKRAVAEAESALATLAGRSPRDVFTPVVSRDGRYREFTTVPEIPAGLTSDLLERRPDIAQAEAQLAAANMRIDVARADYFPAINLTGVFGSEAAALGSLFSGPAAIWSIGAALTQPLIGLKAIEANVEAQTARRNELVIDYTKTVQQAFRDTHDALSANRTTREALAAQNERAARLAQTLELSNLRYQSGYSPYLEVLDSQRQLLQAQTLAIVAARNARGALVSLAQALGGGWDYPAAVAKQ
jgi:multidrug efflux system outer membrane protein